MPTKKERIVKMIAGCTLLGVVSILACAEQSPSRENHFPALAGSAATCECEEDSCSGSGCGSNTQPREETSTEQETAPDALPFAATPQSSLIGCFKNPAAMWACIQTGVVNNANLAKNFCGKNGMKIAEKLRSAGNGEIIKGGRHIKVLFPNRHHVALSHGCMKDLNLLKKIMQQFIDIIKQM